jgi:hypothetical protein
MSRLLHKLVPIFMIASLPAGAGASPPPRSVEQILAKSPWKGQATTFGRSAVEITVRFRSNATEALVAVYWPNYETITSCSRPIKVKPGGCTGPGFGLVKHLAKTPCRSFSTRIADQHPTYNYVARSVFRCQIVDQDVLSKRIIRCKLGYTRWFMMTPKKPLPGLKGCYQQLPRTAWTPPRSRGLFHHGPGITPTPPQLPTLLMTSRGYRWGRLSGSWKSILNHVFLTNRKRRKGTRWRHCIVRSRHRGRRVVHLTFNAPSFFKHLGRGRYKFRPHHKPKASHQFRLKGPPKVCRTP